MRLKHLVQVPLALIVAFTLVACGGPATQAPSLTESKKPTAAPEKKPEEQVKRKPDLSISAVELSKEFVENEKAAKAKYKGKTLQVDGVLRNMPQLTAGGETQCLMVGFTVPERFRSEYVQCVFQPQLAGKVEQLNKGQNIKVLGNYVDDSSVVLRECELLEVGPDPGVRVTATQLTKEFADDAGAAEKKYTDKALIVEGVLADLNTAGKDPGFAKLSGAKDGDKQLYVMGQYTFLQTGRKQQFAKLKKGDTVTIRGAFSGFAGDEVTLDDCIPSK